MHNEAMHVDPANAKGNMCRYTIHRCEMVEESAAKPIQGRDDIQLLGLFSRE